MQNINALPAQAADQIPNPTSQTNPLKTNALELKDIHVPEQISNYPVAYGWWLLVALLIFITVISINKLRKAAKRNQVKKQALAQLKNNPEMTISDTIALLKWAAMHYFSRAELAKLFGNSLQSFYTSHLPNKHQENFTNLSEQAFINQYHANASTDENLHQAAVLWLTHALPPKAIKIADNTANINSNTKQGVNT